MYCSWEKKNRYKRLTTLSAEHTPLSLVVDFDTKKRENKTKSTSPSPIPPLLQQSYLSSSSPSQPCSTLPHYLQQYPTQNPYWVAMGCSESTPKGGKKGTAPVRRQQKEQSPKNSAQDVQEKVTEPAATATAPPSPPPPNNATPDNQKIPPADKIPPSVRSNDDELFDRSIKSLARSRGGSRTRSPKDGHLDIRSMSSEDTSQFALNASTGGLVRCATLNMSFSHGSPQGGSKPQVPPSVQAVKQIVGDKAMIDSLEETARLQRDPMPPAMLGEGLNGAASPISEKSTHSITVSIPRLPPQASSCGGSGLIDVQQILSGSESDDIIATESGSESNEIHRDKSISKSEGGGRSNLLSPEPSGNLYLASSKSLLRLRSLRQTSHAMSFTTDFLAKSHNGGQYMLKITACDAEPTKVCICFSNPPTINQYSAKRLTHCKATGRTSSAIIGQSRYGRIPPLI